MQLYVAMARQPTADLSISKATWAHIIYIYIYIYIYILYIYIYAAYTAYIAINIGWMGRRVGRRPNVDQQTRFPFSQNHEIDMGNIRHILLGWESPVNVWKFQEYDRNGSVFTASAHAAIPATVGLLVVWITTFCQHVKLKANLPVVTCNSN